MSAQTKLPVSTISAPKEHQDGECPSGVGLTQGAKRSPLSNLIRGVLSLSLTVALLWWMFSKISVGEFMERIVNVERSGVLLFAVISITGLFIRALRYFVLVKGLSAEGRALPLFDMVTVTAIRNACVDSLPARMGELAFVYVTHRLGATVVTAGTTFAFSLVLDILVLLFLIPLISVALYLFGSPFGSEMSAASNGNSELLISSVILLVGVAALVGLWNFHRILSPLSTVVRAVARPLPHKLNNFVCKTWGEFTEAIGHFNEQGTLPLLLLLTVGVRVFKYGGLVVLLGAVLVPFGYSLSEFNPIMIILAFLSGEMSASLPVSGFFGFGAYATAWSAVFSTSRVTLVDAAQIVTVNHLITQIIAYGIGLLAFGVFLLRARALDARRERGE